MFGDNDHLLFGAPQTNVDLSTLHPQPVQIFRLWQLYLDNVNPLLKVTHTPSLQGRIIEAASHVSNIEPPLEALMFSIYCIALVSLDDNAHHCLVSFGSPIEDLLTRFQFGCRQALQNCGFLRTNDRDCLTALCLYLVRLPCRLGFFLIFPDVRSAQHRSSIPLSYAGRGNSHCPAHGNK